MNADQSPPSTRVLACSRCGGALAATSAFDLLRCRHCGTDHLVRDRGDVSAVAPQGRISSRRAHRALLDALLARGIPGANVHEGRLVWLPFWQVRAKLVGWQVYQHTVVVQPSLRGPSGGERSSSSLIREQQRVEELVARDLDVSLPACDTRGWGLLGITSRIEHLRLRPFSIDREAQHATVATAVVPKRAAERRAQALRSSGLTPAGAVGVRQRLSLVRVRTRLIYYPVWKLRYTIAGEPGEADVDGIRGVVLRGDAARVGASNAPWWLGAAAASGWLTGLHPALGVLGLLTFASRRSRHWPGGSDPMRWGRWLGQELDPCPLVRVPVEE
jgi:DNA-directed RNA polymerase subunit RPC12/RpoP